jgi:hypothetical protein
LSDMREDQSSFTRWPTFADLMNLGNPCGCPAPQWTNFLPVSYSFTQRQAPRARIPMLNTGATANTFKWNIGSSQELTLNPALAATAYYSFTAPSVATRTLTSAAAPAIQPFRFIAVADPHFFNRDRNPYFLDRFEDMLHKAIALNADFVIILGDIVGVQPPEQVFPDLKEIIDRVNIPVYLVRGNHDYPSLYNATFGSSNYFFDHKGWRFVGMDESLDFRIHPVPAAITDAPAGNAYCPVSPLPRQRQC